MFEKLRQQSAESMPTEPAAEEAAAPVAFRPVAAARPRRRSSARLSLGLTPPQRFLLALMLFLNVSVLGFFALIAFEKIWLPF